MSKKESILALIREQSMLPLFYHDSEQLSLEVVKSLYAGGVKLVEYTNRGPKALANFSFLRKAIDKEMPGMKLGIGTIRTPEDAEAFIQAGADFVVCPVVNKEVGDAVHTHNLLWIPGCQTSTEIDVAERAGAKLVKIFPGNILGPGFISAVKEIFPNISFMPTGGVEPEEGNLKAWFNSGVVAVGMGSKLISKTLLEQHNFLQLTESSIKTLSLIQRCKK